MKSHVSILQELVCCIIRDAHTVCATNESAERDIKTLISRVKHEGLSFLTITLPQFGADFERCLDQSCVEPKYFRMFRKYRQIPAFLQGIVAQVFDADTGRIKDEPSVEAIRAVRQVAYGLKKLKLACSSKRTSRAYQGFISDERDLEVAIFQTDLLFYRSVCRSLWYWLSDSRITSSIDTVPRHGPGNTADGITGNQKYRLQRWHERLEPYFPLLHFAFSSESAYGSEEFENVSLISECDELPVKVITVPKTLKSPRIIAMEPVCTQYAQQALSQVLCRELESAKVTSGHLNFTDQKVNQRLALRSSEDGSMCTLDLTSASDRVPLSLVEYMFESAPDFLGAVLACRSRSAKLPDGQVLTLKKFASMGSALCFPIESMYFYTICVGALLKKRNLPVTPQNALKVSRDVYVYGDDIIVPTNDVATVIDHLQKYYCKVGTAKSFWTGKFRESCGMDAYNGKQVTPVYVRELPPNDRRAASGLISWVKTSNLLEKACYWSTASFLMERCQKILGKLPRVGGECAGLGRETVEGSYDIERYNKRYQVVEVKTWVPSTAYRKDELSGYSALTKCLLSLESRLSNESKTDKKHLARTARYGTVTLKRRWVRPY